MTPTEVAVGIAILVGLVGIVVPVLPGSLLVLAAILVWAVDRGGAGAWTVLALAAALLALGTVVKYAVPGRRLKASGVPTSTLAVGGLGGLVGFFVVPVVGLVLGFVAGVYAAERRRLGPGAAWPSTKAALRAVGLSIAIEMAAALLATGAWVVGVVLT
ncbi:MAG TPA: DUF456 domain-containing protein [Nocardioides sp.]|nr:DUF456 domain-containing protein [Nocardioides sp.]